MYELWVSKNKLIWVAFVFFMANEYKTEHSALIRPVHNVRVLPRPISPGRNFLLIERSECAYMQESKIAEPERTHGLDICRRKLIAERFTFCTIYPNILQLVSVYLHHAIEYFCVKHTNSEMKRHRWPKTVEFGEWRFCLQSAKLTLCRPGTTSKPTKIQ